MTVAADGLHQSGRGHFFTKVVMSVCSQPVVAVDEGNEGEGFRQARKLQFLEKKRGQSRIDVFCVQERHLGLLVAPVRSLSPACTGTVYIGTHMLPEAIH